MTLKLKFRRDVTLLILSSFYFPADYPLRVRDCQLIGSLHVVTYFELSG